MRNFAGNTHFPNARINRKHETLTRTSLALSTAELVSREHQHYRTLVGAKPRRENKKKMHHILTQLFERFVILWI